MPRNLSKGVVLVDAASYCSAPPLATSSRLLLLPPRLMRAQEARRPHAPLRVVKREVRESEPDSVEYAVDVTDEVDVKPDIGPTVECDPRQLTACVAAISIRRPHRLKRLRGPRPQRIIVHKRSAACPRPGWAQQTRLGGRAGLRVRSQGRELPPP